MSSDISLEIDVISNSAEEIEYSRHHIVIFRGVLSAEEVKRVNRRVILCTDKAVVICVII